MIRSVGQTWLVRQHRVEGDFCFLSSTSPFLFVVVPWTFTLFSAFFFRTFFFSVCFLLFHFFFLF
jgi:hypothetical protein